MNNARKPRALFIVPAYYEALEQKGVLDMLKQREEQDYFEKIITIHPLAPKDQTIRFSPGQTIKEFKKPQSPQWRSLKAFFFALHLIKIIRILSRLVKTEDFDFIRAQDPYIIGFIGYAVARLSGKKLCISIHSDYLQRHKLDPVHGAPKIFGNRTLAEKLEIFILKRADLVLPIRESLKRQYVSRGIDETKIRVFPHAVDLSPYKKEPVLTDNFIKGISPDNPILSFVGRFSKENYIYDYLEVAKKLGRHYDFQMVLAGGGTEEDTIKEKVENDEGLKSKVLLPGFIDSETVRILRQRSYINLSLMGGLSLIEACAAGKPVISYDVEWHHELVQSGITGYLIPEKDIDELCSKIEYLFKNPDLADKMGHQARNKAFTAHDISLIVPLRQKIYNELLQR